MCPGKVDIFFSPIGSSRVAYITRDKPHSVINNHERKKKGEIVTTRTEHIFCDKDIT